MTKWRKEEGVEDYLAHRLKEHGDVVATGGGNEKLECSEGRDFWHRQF